MKEEKLMEKVAMELVFRVWMGIAHDAIAYRLVD